METENITDYIKNIDPKAERRFFSADLELRAEGNEIAGYAAVFEKNSEDFGGWVERIDKRAFDDVLDNDAFALFNHNPNFVLARNKFGLTLTVDDTGLRYSFIPPNTSLGNDVKELIRSKVITKSSFAFTVGAQEWNYSKNPNVPSVRTIKKVSRLFDVAPVTYPAYPDTTVGVRSYNQERTRSIVIPLDVREFNLKRHRMVIR